MMNAQAYIPIIAAAAAEMAVGMVWYSDQAFGPMWRKITGNKMPKDLTTKFALHAAISILKATALFIAISVFQKTQTAVYAKDGLGKIFAFFLKNEMPNNTVISAMKTAGFLWMGLLAPSKACSTVWGDNNWKLFAIESAGSLATLVTMAATIAATS